MSSRPGVVLLLGSALLAAACDRQAAAPEQANSVASGASPDEVTSAPAAIPPKSGVFDRSRKGEAAPAVTFTAPDGEPVTLADFKGKPLLVNLWATWCAPCVAEMPTLDAAAGRLGDQARVLVVSQDLEGAAKVRPFFAARNFKHLQPYLDTNIGLSTAYQANLPTTVLYDSAGREVWRRLGGYDWSSAEAIKAIAEAR